MVFATILLHVFEIRDIGAVSHCFTPGSFNLGNYGL
jgi:hypothetical protein